MGVPATAVKAKVRTVLVKEMTGPIRAIPGEKITFKILKCTVDGKASDGSDLTDDEAKKINWVIKEATSKPFSAAVGSSHVASYKLVVGRELSRATGKQIDYTIPGGMAGKAVAAMAYVNSPSNDIAQWVKIAIDKNFQASSTSHKALTTFPQIDKVDKLDNDFKEKWDAFQAALDAAGADVTISSTLRSLGRAYLMHYSTLLAKNKIKPWEIPDQITNSLGNNTGQVGVEWSHTLADGRVDESKSKKSASAMMQFFKIAYPASLTSNHVRGKAIDVSISWSGTLKIKEKGSKGKDDKAIEGKVHEIKSTPRHGGTKAEPAGNKELREVAESFGVHKLLTDAPHWSVDGK